MMVSLGVTSLFTSIDLDVAINTIMQLFIEKHNDILVLTPYGLQRLLHLCLKTYFVFENKVYVQKRGTPMGSPISSIIAEAVMQRLEQLAIPKIKPKIWMRYVDDTFVIIKRDEIDQTISILNETIPNIAFTVEKEHELQLSFLDILIKRTDQGFLETTVYRKVTHTDQILNYNSNHPVQHKASCVNTLFARIDSHCSTLESRVAEKQHLIQSFRMNGYPIHFVKRCLKRYRQPNALPPSSDDQGSRNIIVVLPYIKSISEIASHLLGKHGIRVAHKPVTSIRQVVSRLKDKIPNEDKHNIVYQIDCLNCVKQYVGQSS